MRCMFLALMAVAALAQAAPGRADVAPGPYAVTLTRDIKYGPYTNNVLDLCAPQPTADQYQGRFPGMVFVHGGSWSAYNQHADWAQCLLWASYGYVGITIQYRLVDGSQPYTWWPAQIVDSQLAVRWFKTNQSALNMNPAALCALGDSAGGQLVEYLGYQPYIIPGDLQDYLPNSNPHINCIVSEFGPSGGGPSLQLPGAPDPATARLIPQYPTLPATTLLVQGTQDTTVTPYNSIVIYNELMQYDGDVQYLSYVGGHEFRGLTQPQIDDIRRAELQFTDSWAASRGVNH